MANSKHMFDVLPFGTWWQYLR